jgi:hypothetical protein
MATDWITTKEAIELSDYTSYHLRDLLRQGRVKGQRFGEVWQVSRKSLLAYLKEQGAKGEKRGRKSKLDNA